MKTIEELEAELETVTRERDRSLFAWEAAGMTGRTAQSAMLELARQLEDAKAHLAFIEQEYANEQNQALTEDALCLKIAGLTHQRDEARAEVERLTDASTHWQVMCKRETEEVERLARQVELLTDERDELLVRVANQDAELRATREAYNGARTDVPALIARVRELEAECERMKTFAAQSFSAMIRQEAEQMREYGLSYEGVRKVLHEYNDGEISFGKLMDLIRAAARAMAEDMQK
jgi:chromosome segregation ATPase